MELKKKGRLGEDLAVKYLIEKGYQVLERNLYIGRLEIDIIASKEEIIYFFEVKSSYLTDGESPLVRIDTKKLNHLYRAAFGYLADKKMNQAFEVMGISVCVALKDRRATIEVVSCGLN